MTKTTLAAQESATETLPLKLSAEITKLPADFQVQLASAFAAMAATAEQWTSAANAIVVTDASHTDAMAKAREARLELKAIRCRAEEERKRLKAGYLDAGRKLDAVARIITEPCEWVEAILLGKEQFVERQAAAERARITAERSAKLRDIGANPDLYQVSEFTDANFDLLLNGIQVQQQQERDRLALAAAQESAERKRTAELQAENERLRKAEQEAARVRRLNEWKAAQEAKRVREEHQKELDDAEAKRKAEAEEANRILKARDDAAREERDTFARAAEADRWRKRAEEETRIAEEKRLEAAKIAMDEAPDVENLRAFIAELKKVPAPAMKTPWGRLALQSVFGDLDQMIAELMEE